MNVTNGNTASEEGGASGGGYVLFIYPRLQGHTAGCCKLVVPRGATAISVVQDAVATLGVGGGKLHELVEVREVGGVQHVLEGADCPVERVLLWPPHAQQPHPQSQGYYFHLQERSHGNSDHGDCPLSEEGIDNLCDLPILTEASILANLRTRFHSNQIYTYAGGVLLAVNPFRFLPVYNPKYVKLYDGHRPGQLAPHVFAVADLAFYSMLRQGASQCVVLTGESGSGKTQSANFLLHCLTALSRKGYANGVERTVLGAGPVLEAFGNAKTAQNDNSSRFGKLIQAHYLESGVVRGALLHRYLLEKSRVVSREPCERNYHVFYYMLAGASEEERRELKLLQPQDYLYLTQVSPVQDSCLASEYNRLQQAMEMVGFLPPTRRQIFSVLSAILYLGNLTYTCRETDTDQGLEVGPGEALNTLSRLLQVKQEMLVEVLTKRKILKAKNTLSFPYSQSEAIAVRDSMAKALYSALFDRIILRINHSLLNRKDITDPALFEHQCLFIGILDLFGFEKCRANGFEQFCINYASELLQYYFNQHIFELEQEEYQTEGLTWQTINYRDNSGCIHLFNSQPHGLIHLLYEENSSPQATDRTLLDRFEQEHHGNPFFWATPTGELAFVIQHFPGKVKYQIKDFRVKDADRVPAGVIALLKHSDRAFVRSLVRTDPVAVFRWGVVRAIVRIIAAFKQAGLRLANRNAGQRWRGSRTPIGQLRRKSSTMVEQLQSRRSLLEFSFDRSEDHPLEIMEDIFASYERRKKSKGNRQKQIIPKNLISTRSLQCIVGLTLRDPTMPLHMPCTSAQFQVSLCKLLQTLKRAHPFFIQCIRSNAEKKEMCFDDELVLAQLQYSGLLQTVRMQKAGYSAKFTFQEFTETFQVLLPKARAAEPQRDILALLQEAGLDSSTYQIGKTKVLLRAAQWQMLQERQSLELQRMIVVLQRWYRARHERREFQRKRVAAIIIQRWWRGISEESRHQAAAMIQALWRGSQQRAGYLKQRASIIKMQALVRASSARRRCQYLKNEQEGGAQDKGAEPGEVGMARSPPLQKASTSQRTPEGKELQRQDSLGYEAPPPPQVKGQGATNAAETRAAQLEKEEGKKRGEMDGPPCPASPGTLQRYYKHTAMKKKAAKWRERRSEGGFLDSSPQILNLKDKRTEDLMSRGLSLSLDNVSTLSSSESDSPATEKSTEEVRVRLRRRSKRKRRLAHARSGLMFKSVALEDAECWTFPLPPISPAPSGKPNPPSHSEPDGLPHSKPCVQTKSLPEATPESSKVTIPRRRSSGSSPVSPGRPGFLSRLLRKRTNRELHHRPVEPAVTPTQARGLGWSPAAPLRPSSGHSRRNPSIRISRATRVSEQWNASLEREITSTSELWHLDEFLGNQVNELRSRGKQLSTAENIFLSATMAFRETIKGMYSLSKPQIRYKGLMRNYKDKVTSLAGQKQEAEVKLVLNLFQSVLDGFVRGEMRREDSLPTKPSKKEKSSSKDKFESVLDHTLRTYQVNIMQSCDQCGSYIWGMEKAFMCCSCKMICHKKCLSKISTDCSTLCAKKYDGETDTLQFGVRVSLLISSSNPVPIVMEKMLGHVEMNGLYTEGIYRKSGSASRARELHQVLDSDVQSVCLEDYPIHTITSLVKKWLRELPDPLMTFTHYDDFLRAVELPEKREKLRRLYKVLEQLPPANFNTLERLFFHLVIVAKEEKHNRMTSNSLAIVFAPCLLRSPNTSDPFMCMNDIGKTTMCVEMLINEQLRRYTEKMGEIEQLELAEAMAINQLKRQNTVLEKAPEAATLEPPDMEERSLMERIKSIKQEKDELACRLPELEQPGSDHENLDSVSLLSCESLLDIRFRSPCAEGSKSGKEVTSGTPHPTPASNQEPSRRHAVQSMYVTPSQGPASEACKPAQQTGRTLSETDIPYIDEDM
ncbi:unconventional myosin-IXb-like isoform X1 [Anguilla anguilla]|uniref:unconventional myosin-IXb-like isoform X1 n=1 Tax=Anguilla anguilla TaxID=7936 RepID=UPI0015A8D4DA|nr:unconventional myosin-IXb-like isoform X1 [Anguilla anguilla]XP_035277847.1 unconventional myosin-IXb-like isoform X1 [Anguilla anguilla]